DFCLAIRASCDVLSPGNRRYRLGLSVSSAFRRWSASASFADCTVRTPDRPPEVRSTAFAARLPDLQPWPLMDVDFAISCPLVRPRLPLSGFCTSGRGFATRFLQTPPRDDALAFLLILHLHQVGQGTFTPKLSIMLGT